MHKGETGKFLLDLNQKIIIITALWTTYHLV